MASKLSLAKIRESSHKISIFFKSIKIIFFLIKKKKIKGQRKKFAKNKIVKNPKNGIEKLYQDEFQDLFEEFSYKS